jgi:hypothetical protein
VGIEWSIGGTAGVGHTAVGTPTTTAAAGAEKSNTRHEESHGRRSEQAAYRTLRACARGTAACSSSSARTPRAGGCGRCGW